MEESAVWTLLLYFDTTLISCSSSSRSSCVRGRFLPRIALILEFISRKVLGLGAEGLSGSGGISGVSVGVGGVGGPGGVGLSFGGREGSGGVGGVGGFGPGWFGSYSLTKRICSAGTSSLKISFLTVRCEGFAESSSTVKTTW